MDLRDRVLGPSPRPETIRGWLKSASKIGSNTNFSDACTIRSAIVGIPSQRIFPPPSGSTSAGPGPDEHARLHRLAEIGEHGRGPGRGDRPWCDLVDPGRAGALVGPHPVPRRSEEGRVIDQVEHIIETAARIGHRPTVQLGLHPKYPRPRLRGVDGPRDTGIHQCVSFPVNVAAILLGPFPRWPAFPASEYYGPSAPSRPDQQAMRPPGPGRRWRRRRAGRAGTVPTFIREPFDGIGTQLCPCTIATTTPQSFTVASPTGDITQPRSSPPARGRRVRDATRPTSARFWVGGFVLRGVQPLVPHVCLSVSLAEPVPSGSTGTARRCRGLLHQPPPCRGSRPSSSFKRLLRQAFRGVLSPPQGSRTPRGARCQSATAGSALVR